MRWSCSLKVLLLYSVLLGLIPTLCSQCVCGFRSSAVLIIFRLLHMRVWRSNQEKWNCKHGVKYRAQSDDLVIRCDQLSARMFITHAKHTHKGHVGLSRPHKTKQRENGGVRFLHMRGRFTQGLQGLWAGLQMRTTYQTWSLRINRHPPDPWPRHLTLLILIFNEITDQYSDTDKRSW